MADLYVPKSPDLEEFLRMMEERRPPKSAKVLGQSQQNFGSPTPFEGMGPAGGEQMRLGAARPLVSLLEGGGGASPGAVEPQIPPAVRDFVRLRAEDIPSMEDEGMARESPDLVALGGRDVTGTEDTAPLPSASPPPQPDPDEERRGRIGEAEGWATFLEGVGNIKAPDVGAARIKALTGRDVAGPAQPFRANAFRREAARAEDELTQAEIQSLRNAGINVQPGMTASRMRHLGLGSMVRRDPVSQGIAQGHLDARREEMEMERERLGLSKGNLAARHEGLAQARERLGRPPAGQLDKSLSIARVKKFLDRIEESYDEVRDKVGPVFGRLQVALRTFGLNDPKVAQLQAELTDAMGDYLTLKTGAQRGMPEMTFLLQALPRISDSNATFDQLMQSWRQRVDDEASSREELFEELGYKGSGAKQARSAGDTVTFRANDGTTVRMPRAEAEEDVSAGEGEIVE